MSAEQVRIPRTLLEHSISRRAILRTTVNVAAGAVLMHGMVSLGQAADAEESINQAIKTAHEMEQQTPAALGQVELIKEEVAPEQASAKWKSWRSAGEMVAAGVIFEGQHLWSEYKKGIKKERGLD